MAASSADIDRVGKSEADFKQVKQKQNKDWFLIRYNQSAHISMHWTNHKSIAFIAADKH